MIIKSPFRNDSAEQSRARKELDREMGFLDGKLKGRPGIRQLLDRIPVGSPSEPVDAAVLEYGVTDLCHLHFVEARQLSLPQIKAIAQQLLRGLSSIHGQGIVHTGEALQAVYLQNMLITPRPQTREHSFHSFEIRIFSRS